MTLVAAIAGCGFTGAAVAQDDGEAFYAGLAIESFRLEVDGNFDGEALSARSRPVGLTVRGGWNAFTWLGLEGFASFGIHDDPNSGSFDGGDDIRNGETELKSAYGLAAKPRYSVTFGRSTTIIFYALGGYSAYEYESELTGDNALGPPQTASYSIDDSSVYYGAGLELGGALTLQYVEYADEDDHEISAWQIGVIRSF